MAQRRPGGPSKTPGSSSSSETSGTAPSASDITELEKFEPPEGGEAGHSLRRRRDGPGQAPADRRPCLRPLAPLPDHVLRRGRRCRRRDRGRLAHPGVDLRQAADPLQGHGALVHHPPAPSWRRSRTRPGRPVVAMRRAGQPLSDSGAEPLCPALRRRTASRAPRLEARATSPASQTPSSPTTRSAARPAHPGSARSSARRVTGMRQVSPARSTISGTRRQHRRVDRSLRLVHEPPHRRLHQLLQEALQPRAVDGCDGIYARRSPSRAARWARRRRRTARAPCPADRGPRRPLRGQPFGSHQTGWLPARAPHLPATHRELKPSSRPRQPQPTISARTNYSSCSPPRANGPRPRARNAWSSRACRSTSTSVISSAPRFRRSAFCASII